MNERYARTLPKEKRAARCAGNKALNKKVRNLKNKMTRRPTQQIKERNRKADFENLVEQTK